ncbi:MAG: GNAT family N-acetyltransferase [Sphingobium sp.]
MALHLHTGYLPGAIGRIVHLHADFYARTSGFGLPFEAKVATELSEFMQRYDAARDLLAVAMMDGSIEASIAIDGRDAEQKGAHLRWFIASDRTRGQGIGSALLKMALDHVDLRGYPKCYLWTFEGLQAAGHLYSKSGFRLAQQARGTQWGTEVNEQMFVRLTPDRAVASV